MSRPKASATREPAGFLVTVDDVTRLHFLDWGEPGQDPSGSDRPVDGTRTATALLLHGMAGTAWTWSPVARRLAGSWRVIAPDLRGHGLSDAPTAGYSLDDLAGDAVAVAEAAGLLEDQCRPVVAGHGFGAQVAVALAVRLGQRCAGLVLVDGGWEDLGVTGLEPTELLAALEEPPEVMRSLASWLEDREAFDPPSWDADQERAARAAVIELPVGRVVRATRPHVLAACVETMLAYRPAEVISGVQAPIAILSAADDESRGRRQALAALTGALSLAGHPPLDLVDLPDAGHNLMRYHPDEVAGAIRRVAARSGAYHPR